MSKPMVVVSRDSLNVFMADIYIFNQYDDGSMDMFKYDKPSVRRYTVKESEEEQIPPSMKMDRNMLVAFRDAIDRTIGKADVPSVEAKLEATLYHLEDMRALMKLDKKI